ncbi:low temperature requirement protein A [Micromonospora palythoicola]|uniref:low temperature requirement protein A n=1 Tax=Micromonospora palythoicola TaxID=3120507 RepID=UPI002FCE5FC1
MTTGRLGVLLRRPDQSRPAFLELFFDLVFVLAFLRLSQELFEQLSWTGAFQTLVLLLAVLAVWFSTARFLDAFDPQHRLVQLLTMPIIFGTLVMAAATPEAFGRTGLVFAGTYVTVRLGGLAVAIFYLRGHAARTSAVRLAFWAGMAAIPWIAGALLTGGGRAVLWMTAAVIEYAGIALGFPTPKLGRSGERRLEVVVSEEHTAERYQQFFIIALGEPILVTGLTLGGGDFGADQVVGALLAFTTTALLWRVYIHRAGALLAEAIAATANPRRVAILTIYSHVIMVAGIITMAVGDELVIAHPLGHAEPAWTTVILGGPALFLVGRAAFEYAVFGRVSAPRVTGALALAAVTPATRSAPPIAVAGIAALVLAGVAVADTLRARRVPSETPSPPG